MATRAQLRTRSQVRADQDSATFISEAQWNDWLDEAAKEVWYDLIRAGWPIAHSTVTFTLDTVPTARLTDYGVTGTVAFIRGVYRSDGSNVTALHRLNEGDRAALYSTTGGIAGYYYASIHPTEGPLVEIRPFEAGGTFIVEYIAEFAGFTSDGQSWYGPARSDELICILTAAKAMRKEGNDQGAAQMDKEYLRVFEKVTTMASWYDLRNPPTITDSQTSRMQRDLSDWNIDLIG